jgi:hypothetical protein
MLLLNPTHITLNTAPLPAVTAIAVSRKAKSLLTDFTDTGPHPTFADVPERITMLTITRHLLGPDDAGAALSLGDQLDLAFTAKRTPDAPHALRFSARIVLTAIESALTESKALTQTITAVAVSTNGSSDPLTIEPISTLTQGA